MRSVLRAAPVLVLFGLLTACRLNYTGGAKPVSSEQLDDGWHRAAPTPVVLQEKPMDCGLASLAMLAGAWGQRWTLAELQRQQPPGDKGVKLGSLRDLARARGLQAFAVKGTHADLERELANHRPVLLGLLLPFERRRALAHYEVAIAINPRDGAVVTQDPATGKLMVRSKQVLEQEWKPSGYATLVVVGTAPASR
jgi:ABC-type bacteriocin/lantibiotic exporter with double-glycine peptidase domain